MILLLSVAIYNVQAQNTCDPKKEKVTKKNSKAGKGGTFGAAITKDGAILTKELPALMANENSKEVKIHGQIAAVCQVKGCWMTTELGNGQNMRIRFKDYGFFVPKDADGKHFFAKGVASWHTTTVEELRHYAEDAGKSKEEIEKITQPKKELVFLAEGVIIEGIK